MATKKQLRAKREIQVNRVNAVVKAYDRVKAKLESFSKWTDENFHSVFDSLTEEQREEKRAIINSFNWNNWHDLESRLEDRYHAEMGKVNDIDWELNGFVAYN